MTLNTLETSQPDDPLPLIHPELTDWENEGYTIIDTFSNDHVISIYLNAIQPATTSTRNFSNASSSQVGANLLVAKKKIKKTISGLMLKTISWQH